MSDLREKIIEELTTWDGQPQTQGKEVPVCIPFLVDRIERLILSAMIQRAPAAPAPSLIGQVSEEHEVIAQSFAEQYRSGAQGAEMDADTAQAIAASFDALLSVLRQPIATRV